MIYDTLKHYIESCYANDDSYEAFPAMARAITQFDVNDTTRIDKFRDWLISVIYLNKTSPYYFCADLEVLVQEPGKYHNVPNATIAGLKYLIDSTKCSDPGIQQEFKNDTASRRQNWLSSGDTSKPIDTTLPSLDSIGLGFLLGHGLASAPLVSATVPLSFTVSNNPFIAETKLRFDLSRMTYATVEVYDVLGNKVFGNAGRSYDAGSYEINLDGNSLPSGTLYARITTGFGEVKTVKLVHEK